MLPAAAPIALDSAEWHAWLDDDRNPSFVYRDAGGGFTARRERQRNGWYWYAYRRVGGKVRKRYLGRAADLNAARLRQVAAEFAAIAAPGAPTMPPQSTPLAALPARIRPPLPRPALVERPRLMARLDAALATPLTLVSAPAGFGKSTLLAAWAARAPELTLAWISIDTELADAGHFWGTVAAAIEETHPASGASLPALLEAPQTPSPSALVQALLRDLGDGPDRLALVLDDYHLIDSPAIHEALTILVDRLPPHIHLIIGTRADPPLPLARWRVQGRLAELRAADLRFTTEEAAAFLHSTMGLDLPPEAIQALEERTEGWAAALQLAALSIRDRADAATFIARFAGSHRAIVDYLAEEVIGRQPPHVQAFLLQTSILERLSANLCDSLLQPDDGAPALPNAQELLDYLERANLFVIPLDEERRWYRYHHLFAEMLRDRLQRTQPGATAELNRRAAQWYRAASFPGDAISHLLLAGDLAGAAEIITRVAEEMMWEYGDAKTVLRWIAALPDDIVLERPRLALWHIWALQISIQLDAAEERAGALERTLHQLDAHEAAIIAGELAAVRSIAARINGNAARAIELAGIALDCPSYGNPSLAHLIAAMSLVDAYSLLGDLVQAERAAAELRAAAADHHNLLFAAIRLMSLGGLQRDQGRLAEARALYEEARRLFTRRNALGRPIAAMLYISLADIAYEQDNLDEAERYAQMAFQFGERWWNNDVLGNSLSFLGAVRQARGDHAAAAEIFERVERLHLEYQVVWVTNQVQAGRAQRLLHTGQRQAAERWADASGLTLDDTPAPERFYEYLALARVALARGQAQAVLPLLDRLEAPATRGRHVIRLIDLKKVRALAFRQTGAQTGARLALLSALELAEPGAMIRIFVDEGETMKWLLADCGASIEPRARQGDAAARRMLNYIDRLMAAFRHISAERAAPQTAAGAEEALTVRELQVLRLLAAGQSDQDIAAALVIAVSTVRSHTKRIYAKLGARNRMQAVSHARNLGLIG